MKRLAIIPARGGSKRIPNKNIRDFCGKPMLAHTLDAARTSGLFDVVHVSTESQAIADVAEKFGYPVDFMRPPALADDFTPIMPVLKYAVEEFARRGRTFDQVWLLMACAPLIAASDLVAAENLFTQRGGQSHLLAVSEFQAPIEWALRRETDGRMVPLQPGMFSVRSQDLEKRYFDAGAFAIFPTATVRNVSEAGVDTGFIGHVLPKGTAVDIDDEYDWMLAEAIYRVNATAGRKQKSA
jgi:N-acylneuraminate cytidylyltransferase